MAFSESEDESVRLADDNGTERNPFHVTDAEIERWRAEAEAEHAADQISIGPDGKIHVGPTSDMGDIPHGMAPGPRPQGGLAQLQASARAIEAEQRAQKGAGKGGRYLTPDRRLKPSLSTSSRENFGHSGPGRRLPFGASPEGLEPHIEMPQPKMMEDEKGLINQLSYTPAYDQPTASQAWFQGWAKTMEAAAGITTVKKLVNIKEDELEELMDKVEFQEEGKGDTTLIDIGGKAEVRDLVKRTRTWWEQPLPPQFDVGARPKYGYAAETPQMNGLGDLLGGMQTTLEVMAAHHVGDAALAQRIFQEKSTQAQDRQNHIKEAEYGKPNPKFCPSEEAEKIMAASKTGKRRRVDEPSVMKNGSLTLAKLVVKWLHFTHLQLWFDKLETCSLATLLNYPGVLLDIAVKEGPVVAHYYDKHLRQKLQQHFDVNKDDIDSCWDAMEKFFFKKRSDVMEDAKQDIQDNKIPNKAPEASGAHSGQDSGTKTRNTHYCIKAAVYGKCTTKGCTKVHRCPFCGGDPQHTSGLSCVLQHMKSFGVSKKGKGKGKYGWTNQYRPQGRWQGRGGGKGKKGWPGRGGGKGGKKGDGQERPRSRSRDRRAPGEW